MSQMFYVQEYGRGFSEILLSKQPIPGKIADLVQPWFAADGLEVFTVPNASLYVSGKKPGVFLSKGGGISHILVKEPGAETLWNLQVLSTDSLELFRGQAWNAEAAQRIIDYMRQNHAVCDFTEFLEKHTHLVAERQAKWDEVDRLKVEKKRLEDEQKARQFAERMVAVGEKFKANQSIFGHEFCDLLHHHGMWESVHPRTKSFLKERLAQVSRNGDYTFYRPRKGRSNGSQEAFKIIKRLADHLDAVSVTASVEGVEIDKASGF